MNRLIDIKDKSDEEWLLDLINVADYQFGNGAGEGIFGGDIEMKRSRTGRVRQIYSEEGYIATYTDGGRLALGLEGVKSLFNSLEFPAYRVVMNQESESYIRDGKNAFSKFVIDVDPEIRPKDEVMVVNENDILLAVGKAKISSDAMIDFNTGVAVKIRFGKKA
jgi:uncharacterized protein with predicted RNA binding PUA domain